MDNRNNETAGAIHSGVSLADLFIEVYRGKWIILACLLLSLLSAFVYLKLATPIYQAQLLAIPVGEESGSAGLGSVVSQFGGLAGLSGGLSGDQGIGLKNEALATITSRSFVVDFLESRNLLPVIFADSWDADKDDWKAEVQNNPPTYQKAHQRFVRESLSVREDRETGVISVAVTWDDREVIADWANDIVKSLNDRLRNRSLEASRKKIDYLQKELGNTTVSGIQQGIYRLLEAELSQMAIANTREEFAFKIIDPAATPDQDSPIKPRRLLALAGALFLGFIIGLMLVSIRFSFRSRA